MKKEIDNSVLIKEYQGATKTGKEMLVRLYGKDLFEPKAKERIKSFEDACKDQGLNPKDVLPYAGKKITVEQQVLNAYAMLRIIAKSLQGNWKADWSDNNDQKKWYPYFRHTGKGFVVNDADYDYCFTFTHVGSRLCFENSYIANYFGAQFIDLHNIILSN